ncbi:ABC transporter ATP-binding protein [Halomonas sp. MCCC 1A17488]|uniref:ABC transporter ATP-binding protein n=1 Tax=Billgrantia sulfidoxydans TaxID=2733484 RepID=A0ABX7W1S5_9GAMM|nr:MULTISPECIES: ABC transporter ATP-binding protein [Halomonas]MCE8016577.1 ABC transporter ATP-binding protein [Halomonas sp. MCCC 1A17488]MCG3239910.1 ABC transporter ATP-binding protein [Halomonas sp. MCCC 1A17488]QPP50197.1 ABC transporter ATP-binding protein [Halomonas sp. SS10-MC5]QTP53816.1 ABC transporter ATP-binding protein [Halomonas sulfidoxydans]
MFRFFETLVDPYPSGQTGTPPRELGPFILHFSRPLLPLLAALALLTALVSAAEVVFFSYMGEVVDWLADAEREGFFAEYGWRLAGMAALVAIGLPLLTLLQSLVMHQGIFGNYPMLGRWLAHRHMLSQSLAFYQDEFAGRVSQKVMQTALAIRETVTKLLDLMVYVLVYFAGAMLVMGQAEPWLMLPLLVWLAGYVAILRHYVPRLRRVSMQQADARAVMTGRIVDSYSNIQTIKLFADTRREQAYAREAMEQFMVTVHRQMRLATGLTVSLTLLNSLLLAGVAAVAIGAWYLEAVSLGIIAVAIALVMRIRFMSNWILWEVAALFENIGTVQDGINTIAREQAVQDVPGAGELVVPRGEIRFEALRFGYARPDGETNRVFDGLTLDIAPGEKVGLIGRSGAGKSTLANLLLRFYDLEGGRILIDGQDIAGVTQESLRRKIGMVTQDTSLLHRSVRDNIRYGSPDASEEEIREAVRRAHADTFIDELVDLEGRRGLDAHVGERGVKLSGGQRQRIAIARVLLKDAPILVLDEATSALDSEVEAAIQEQLYTLMEGKSVIAIAHRLSTIAMLDRLVVIDEGEIVESGTHRELLAQGGLYASLWRRQSGGFLGLDTEEEAERRHDKPLDVAP